MEDCDFDNSCKTIILRNSDIFISAFPAKLVFGQVNHKGFIKFKYFQFLHFEFFNLYLAILSIFKYLASEESNILEEKGLILNKEDFSYFWLSKRVEQNNITVKSVVFVIEYKIETIYEVILNIEQFNCFLKCISETIFSCLCLKPVEHALFNFIAEEKTTVIVSLKFKNKCKNMLEKFRKSKYSNGLQIPSVSESNLIDIIQYYNELLIIVQKLKSMTNEENNSDAQRITTLLEA